MRELKVGLFVANPFVVVEQMKSFEFVNLFILGLIFFF